MSFPYLRGLYLDNKYLREENELMFYEKNNMEVKIKELTKENEKLEKDLQYKIKQLKDKQKPKYKKKVEPITEDILIPIPLEDILKTDTTN
jgi:hypothetical protein